MLAIKRRDAFDDPFYRYKMPKVQTNTIGKKGNIRTEVTNLTKIAQSLHVSEAVLLLYLKKGLHTSTVKECLRGEWTSQQIQEKIQDFIETIVLCQTCDLPEIKNGHVKHAGLFRSNIS